MSKVLSKMYHVGQKKPQRFRKNDRYRVYRIIPGDFQTCKRFLLYHRLLSSVMFNTLSTMSYIGSVMELW